MADTDNIPHNYVCHRCSKKGHWIKNCPTNGDAAFDNKRGLNNGLMAAAPTYTYSYPVAQPGTVPSSGPGAPAMPVPQQAAPMDPNAYAAYAAQCQQYAQYQQYAAQCQQYAAAQAAAAPQQAEVPKNITNLTPASYYTQTYKQFQPHTVQISGMDKSKAPNIKEIADKFGTVGTIKLNHHGQASIRCRPDDGLVTVEYESAASVESAIKWFNESEFDGSTIVVQLAPESSPDVSSVQSTPPPHPAAAPGIRPSHFAGPPPPGHPMHGGYGPPRPHNPHAGPRPGDWDCPKCQNSNFQFRTECRRCKEPRAERTEEEKKKEEEEKEEARKNGGDMRGGGRGGGYEMRPRFGGPGPWGRPPPFMHRGPPGMRPPFMGGRPPYGAPRHMMRGGPRGMKRGGGLGRGTKTHAKTKPY